MKVENFTKGTIIAQNCAEAESFIKRFLGLMGRKSLTGLDGLLLKPCNSVHMFFMRFPLDLIFIDKSNYVIYLKEDIKPWKVSKIVPGAAVVLELATGTISKTSTSVGDKLVFK